MLTPQQRHEILKKWENKPGEMSTKNIEDPYIRENTAILLEAHEQDLIHSVQRIDEAANATNTTASLASLGNLDGSQNNDAYKFKPIVIAMMRRTFPQLWAHKVVGVQAMNGPVGLAYAWRALYNDDNNKEIAWEDVDYYAGYTGSTSGTSALLDTTGGVDAYSADSPFYDTSATAAVTSAAEAWEIGTDKPEIKFKLDQQTITAKERDLAGSYTLQNAEDLYAMHGIRVEQELINFINYEIVAQTDRELLYRMKKAAINTSEGGAIIPAINVSGTNMDGRWSAEKYANITTSIIHQCGVIGLKNKRGDGNWVAVSNTLSTILQAMGHPFQGNKTNVNALKIGVSEIGNINGSIKVYKDIYARTDYALAGFKGPTTSDTGVIFCPYLTGLTNRAIDPNTMAPRVQVRMRYAIVDSLLGVGRYYRLIPYGNLKTIVAGAE